MVQAVAQEQTVQQPATTSVEAKMTPYIFSVVIEPDEDTFYADVPALPVCHSWGYTYEHALRNIKEAIELVLEIMQEDGDPIPVEAPELIRKAPVTVGVYL